MSNHNEFYQDYKLVAGQTSPEDALSTAEYPATGSYIDVSGYEWVNVIVHLGAVHASDTPTFEIKQCDGTTGTLDTISTTAAKFTGTATSDDQCVLFYIQTANLADNHHFISCNVTGVANGSYGDIMYYLGGARHQPVTQSTTLVPTANDKRFAG